MQETGSWILLMVSKLWKVLTKLKRQNHSKRAPGKDLQTAMAFLLLTVRGSTTYYELQLIQVLGYTDDIRALGIQDSDEQLSVQVNSRK